MKYREIKRIAGELRKNPTQSESILWNHLRKRKLSGFKFLRQHPLYYEHVNNDHYFFIPDFYCQEVKLIIELDGSIHDRRKEKDKMRDEILKNHGFKILRIKNQELTDMERIKERILNYILKECT